MYFATFHTPCPLSHVQRALDELARAGFELQGLNMVTPEPGPQDALVRIHYGGTASISSDTYLQRLARMNRVFNVQGGLVADTDATRPAVRQEV